MTLLLALGAPIEVSGTELNQTGFVDDFILAPTEINRGSDTRISVSFSEKDYHSKRSGDILTLQMPENLEGSKATIL